MVNRGDKCPSNRMSDDRFAVVDIRCPEAYGVVRDCLGMIVRNVYLQVGTFFCAASSSGNDVFASDKCAF